mgnify:CR=1 FL=1
MSLPLDLKGTVEFRAKDLDQSDGFSPEKAIDAVAAALRQNKALEISQTSTRIEFRIRLARVLLPSGGMGAINAGEVETNRDSDGLFISYRLEFKVFLIEIALAMACLAAFMNTWTDVPYYLGIVFPVFGLVFLSAVNLAQAHFDFRQLLKKAILEPGNSS